MLPILRPWFFASPAADIPAGTRAIVATPHRRTAALSSGRTAVVDGMARATALERGRAVTIATHRRTVEVAR
jgi:hypothetical protein